MRHRVDEDVDAESVPLSGKRLEVGAEGALALERAAASSSVKYAPPGSVIMRPQRAWPRDAPHDSQHGLRRCVPASVRRLSTSRIGGDCLGGGHRGPAPAASRHQSSHRGRRPGCGRDDPTIHRGGVRLREAIDLLTRETFHAIVSDIAMPGRDGYDLMAEIRRLGLITPAVALRRSPTPRVAGALSRRATRRTSPNPSTDTN